MNFRNTLINMHPGIRFMIIITLIFIGLLIAQFISGLLLFLTSSDISLSDSCIKSIDAKYLRIVQLINTIFAFLLPAFLIAYFLNPDPLYHLRLKKKASKKHLAVTLLIIFSGLAIINLLTQWNAQLDLPESMNKIERVIINMEESALMLQEKMLDTPTIGGLLANILIMALITAISEEIMFRGVLQRTFLEWTNNIHLAIIITGFLFSFVHFQFFGFVPRMFLGILFGYLLYWSGSLWIPIVAHFTNNTIALVWYFFYYKSDKAITDPDKVGLEDQLYILIISLPVFAAAVYYFYIHRYKKGKKLNF